MLYIKKKGVQSGSLEGWQNTGFRGYICHWHLAYKGQAMFLVGKPVKETLLDFNFE